MATMASPEVSARSGVEDDSGSLLDLASSGRQSAPSENIADVLLTRTWLDGQVFDQQSHMRAAEKQKVPFTEDTEIAKARINKLKEELLSQSAKHSQKGLVIKRLQLGNTLCTELFESNAGGAGDAKDTVTNRELRELVLQQARLVSGVMKESVEVDVLRDKLRDIRQKNFDLKVTNREAMAQIRQRQTLLEEKAEDFSKHNEGQRKKELLEMQISKMLIQRHTFQGLILGSGINWAQDPDLESDLLGLGEPLDL